MFNMNDDKQIEKLKAEVEKLKILVNRDELTGILNRRGFKEEPQKFISEVSIFRAQLERREALVIKDFSLVIFDIDNFKKINDTFGHLAGDKVIQELSQIIIRRAREIDLTARWGGEEMIVGLPGASVDDAFDFAVDVQKMIESNENGIRFTISAGVAGFFEAESFDQLFKNADIALYEAKNSGKNKVIKWHL